MMTFSIKKCLTAGTPAFLKPYWQRLETSPIGYRLAKGMFWSMTGALISRGLMLVASIFVARMLGKTGFGELGMVQSTVGMFGVFAAFGLGLTATKHVAEFCQSDPDRAGRVIGLSGLFAMVTGGLMALGLFVFAPWLAEHTINAPHLAGILRIGALILFINALNGAQTGALSGFEAFKTIARVNLFVGLISFPIMVGGAYFGGLAGAVWGLAINLGINWLLNHWALHKEIKRHKTFFAFKGCSRELPILWKFSLPVVLSSAIVGPITWACNSIIANQTDGYDSLGTYNAAYNVSLIISAINNMLGVALLPMCVSLFKAQNAKFDFVNIILPWGLGIFLALPWICLPEGWALLFGGSYFSRSMLYTVVFVAFSSIIISHRQGIARNFIAGQYLWWSLTGNLFWGAISITCTYYLRSYGAHGLAASFLVAYVLNTLVFIPFYIHTGLCAKHLLFSRYSILVWVTVIFATTASLLLTLGVNSRFALLGFSYFLILLFFYRFWKTINKNISE